MSFLSSKSDQVRVILHNFSYLTGIQIITLLLPFMYYPYLIRTIGVEVYGSIVTAQVIISIISVVIDFGFNISATKNVSVARDDKNKLSEIVTAILSIKIVLLLISGLILYFMVLYFDFLNQIKEMLFVLFFVLVSDVLFVQWYFQGKEEMHIAALINLISKVVLLALIFILIDDNSDEILFPILLSISSIVSSVLSMLVVFYKDKIYLKHLPISKIKTYFIDAMPFFFSRLSSMAVLKVNSLLVGLFVGASALAYYDLADKLVGLMLMPIYMLNQAVYPNVARSGNIGLVKKIIFYLVPLSICIYVISLFVSKDLIVLFAGEEMEPAYNIFMIMSLLLPINALSVFIGNTVLIVKGKSNLFNLSIIISMFIYMVMAVTSYIFELSNLDTLTWLIVLNALFICLIRLYFIGIKKFNLRDCIL